MIDAGQAAPDFTIPDQDGEPVTLSEIVAGVVVYFYPRPTRAGLEAATVAAR